MAGLVLNGVSKMFDSGVLALYNASLHLSDGEFVAVVGGEKSGKSTLLRIVAGLETVSSGTVELGGKDITEDESRDRDIAMIFNTNTLNMGLNVYENMAYGLKIRHASDTLIEQRVKAVGDMMGLSDIMTRKPKSLTSFQRQKVAFARAIVREPKLYLFDDPMSGFSSDLKTDMINLIVNLQVRMSGTFVYATKNVADALSMATRIVVLKDGLIQQVDTPSNLYDYPHNEYVGFYIGSPTMNFLRDAVVERDGGQYVIKAGDMDIPLSAMTLARFSSVGEYAGTGKRLTVGIRPEDIGKAGPRDACRFGSRIETSDRTDGKEYCVCAVGKQRLDACVPGKPGESVDIRIDPDRIYLFDAATRLTLLERDGGYVNTGYADADMKPLPYDEEERLKAKPSGAVKKQRQSAPRGGNGGRKKKKK